MISHLSSHIIDSVIRLSITSTEFLRMTSGQIAPKHFSSTTTENIATLCFDYFSSFGEAPQDHFHDELVRFLRDKSDDDKDQYITYVEKIRELSEPNAPYILARIADFVKVREREIALPEAADALADGRIEDHDNILYEALKSGIHELDIGLDYLNDYSNIGHNEGLPILTRTGVPALDKMIKGFSRGQLITTLGGYKSGKTWWLQNLARTALLHGLKVCHITLECMLNEMEIRYDMLNSGRGSQNIGETVQYWKLDNRDRLRTVNHKIESISDIKAVTSARKAAHRLGGQLINEPLDFAILVCFTIALFSLCNRFECLILDSSSLIHTSCYGLSNSVNDLLSPIDPLKNELNAKLMRVLVPAFCSTMCVNDDGNTTISPGFTVKYQDSALCQ